MQNNDERILRLAEVLLRTGLHRTMLYEKIKAGQFPKQVKLGTRAMGFTKSSVDTWILERANNCPPL